MEKIMRERTILHIDPQISTTNLGDEIISEAVSSHIRRIFPTDRIISAPSRDVGRWTRRLAEEADCILFGGTNALSSSPVVGYRQFSMDRLGAFRLKNLVLLGVGWWQYQSKFGPFAAPFYRRLLRGDCPHSVRDEYTKNKLQALGIENVLNTGCPTMWDLVTFSRPIPERAVLTITDYHENAQRDVKLVAAVLKKFREVAFWPQGAGDLAYLQRLLQHLPNVKLDVLGPSLKAFDDVLQQDVCYVGTRLHAGVRALQFRRPSFIVPVDNRAVEIAKTDALHLTPPELPNIEVGGLFSFEKVKNPNVARFEQGLRAALSV